MAIFTKLDILRQIMVKIYTEVYGCSSNKDDSNIIKGILIEKGHTLTNNSDESDLVIISTCIVKEVTANKIRHRLKELHNKYKNLIITGCMPEAEKEICRNLFPRASLVNTFNITRINEAVAKVLENNKVEFLGRTRVLKIGLPKSFSKEVTIQIAEGCTSSCSFCETKLAKGYIQSYDEKEIVDEVRYYKNMGVKRFNISSTDNSDYGKDIGTNLTSLLKKIIEIKGDFKIRVGMMNPAGVNAFLDELIEVYKSDKIIKFLHIPVQSGSNKVLNEMSRRYNIKDFKGIVDRFRKEIPNIRISTDVIVGYPTETEEEFKRTLELIKEVKPEVLNISRFSARPGTRASKLKQLTTEEVKRRSSILTKEFKKIKTTLVC